MNNIKYIFYKSILLCYILLLFMACSNAKTSPNEIQFLGFKNVEESNSSFVEVLAGPSIIDSTFIVKLETNNNCLIGKIDKIEFFDQYIIIMDATKAESVFLFSMKGEFITRIGTHGKGPGQYQALRDVFIDKQNSLIGIYDPLKQTILQYDFNNQYVGSAWDFSNLPFEPNKISQINDSTLVVYSTSFASDDDYSIHLVTKTGKVLDRQLPHKISFKNMMYEPFRNPFYWTPSSNSIGIISYFSDTTYTYNFDTKVLKADKIYEFSQPSPTSSDLESINMFSKESIWELMRFSLSKGVNIGVDSFHETDHHTLSTFINSDLTLRNVLYFKESKSVIVYDYADIHATSPPFKNILTTKDGFFVSQISFETASYSKEIIESYYHIKDSKEFKEWEKKEGVSIEINEEYYQILKKTRPEDNPILVFTRLKNSLSKNP